ncbi:hypothetical protein GCM10009616_15030 [Microlunatus lacustris]
MTATPSSRRWPWFISAVCLLVAGGAAGVATYLFWLPCRGSMLDGSILGLGGGIEFSDACLERMDSGTPFPCPEALGEGVTASAMFAAAAIAVTALAWLPVALGLGWRARSRLVALLPVAATLLLAVRSYPGAQGIVGSAGNAPLWLAVEVLGLAAVLLVFRWEIGAGSALLIRLLVLSWGATAFGIVHQSGDYILMIATSSANWDVPPGTGYITSALLALAAAVTMVTGSHRRWPTNWPRTAPSDSTKADPTGILV